MDDDGFAIELFAAELWPDEGEQDTHEEYYDWRGRVGGGGSERYGGCGNKGATIGKILGGTN